MLLILLCIIAGALICYFCSYDRDGMMAVLGGMVGALASIAVCAAAWGLTVACDADYTIADSETTNIVSMKDNYSTYVRHHYSESGMKYTYLYNDEGRGIANKSVPADKSYINYVKDEETPHVVTNDMTYKNPILNGLLWPIGTYTEYYFYVPEGSIISDGQYQIDLE